MTTNAWFCKVIEFLVMSVEIPEISFWCRAAKALLLFITYRMSLLDAGKSRLSGFGEFVLAVFSVSLKPLEIGVAARRLEGPVAFGELKFGELLARCVTVNFGEELLP